MAKTEEEQQIIEEVINNLQVHENCQKAWFIDSPNRIKVLTTEKRLKEVTVQSCKKKLMQALVDQSAEGWDRLRSAFLDASAEALAFLEEQRPDVSSS